MLTVAHIRLRPILMTMLATIFGFLPLALGQGAAMLQPLAAPKLRGRRHERLDADLLAGDPDDVWVGGGK